MPYGRVAEVSYESYGKQSRAQTGRREALGGLCAEDGVERSGRWWSGVLATGAGPGRLDGQQAGQE